VRALAARAANMPIRSSPVPVTLPASLFDARPARFLRRVRGRETFAWSEGFSVEVIVKRVHGRGGRREHDNLEALHALGLPVPRAIAWSQERSVPFGGAVGLAARSLVVMERIEHRETLRDRLAVASPAERARWSGDVLEIVVSLHERGWYHRDLYLQHFLIARDEAGADPAGEKLVLIDLGRARHRFRPLRRWFVKDVAALLHSTPAAVTPRERLRFLARYLDRRAIVDRAARRSFRRAIVRKAARMAGHVPRDERSPATADRGSAARRAPTSGRGT